jgi:hypothetical protein
MKGHEMKRFLTIVTSAAALVALSASAPALAKSNKQPRHSGYEQSYRGDSQYGWNDGWQGRPDPSFGNRAALRNAQRTGRCVEDLGYGRYEYCGW